LYFNPRRLRRPEERVGMLSNAALPPPHITDADYALVRSLRARDEDAFETLVRRYHSPMLRHALGLVRSPEEAEEVIQETWIAVLSGIDSFAQRSTFKTWLFRILTNRARTRARREARMLPFSAFAAQDLAAPEAEDPARYFESCKPAWTGAPSRSRTPEEHVLAKELRQQIETAIADLPRTQQRVLTLRDLEGWSAEEVCMALEVSAANQRVLLHRARSTVRDAVAECGVRNIIRDFQMEIEVKATVGNDAQDDNPTDDELRARLTAARSIAIVGASSKPDRPSYDVMRFLLERGFDVLPVTPKETHLIVVSNRCIAQTIRQLGINRHDVEA
jgi:RNA polymerase sigma-70 factor (ECF subfamily)